MGLGRNSAGAAAPAAVSVEHTSAACSTTANSSAKSSGTLAVGADLIRHYSHLHGDRLSELAVRARKRDVPLGGGEKRLVVRALARTRLVPTV